MGCTCGTAQSGLTSDSFLACAGLQGVEAETQQLKDYVAKAGTPTAGWYGCYALAVVRAKRLIYAKQNYQGTNGDCGQDTGSGIGAGAVAGSLGLKVGGAVLAPFTLGLSSLLGFFTGFFTHHAKAVAKEQGTICSVVVGYNAVADELEAGLQARQISVTDAIARLDAIYREADDALASVAQENPCNAGCGIRYALKALVLYNREVGYQKLAGGLLGGTAGKVGLGVIAAGGGLLLAKAVL